MWKEIQDTYFEGKKDTFLLGQKGCAYYEKSAYYESAYFERAQLPLK